MSHSIEKNADFIKVTYWGTLTNTDIQGVVSDAIMMNGKILDSTNRIEDMRKLDSINLGFNELSNLTHSIQTIQLPRIVKTAILTGSPLQFGIARMFQSILHHPKMKIEVFSNEEEAYNWLSSIDES